MSEPQTKLTLRVVAPTISGPLPVAVDGVVHGAPRGSLLRHVPEVGVCYVLVSGRVHALIAEGEVVLARDLRGALQRRYFPVA